MNLHDRLFPAEGDPGDDARWAASGAMMLSGSAEGPPLLAPRSLVPAIRAVTSAIAESTAERGKAVDLDGLALLGERAAIVNLHRHGRRSCGGAAELLKCADGWIAVSLARESDVELLPAWIGGMDVAERVRTRDADELIDTAIDLGLACSRVGEITATAPAFEVTTVDGARSGRAVSGALVIDLSSLWAGPLCTSVLTAAGARVVKVESAARPDGARRGPGRFYDLLHAGQESVALDFSDAEHLVVLRRLIEAADVVVEASRPRALQQLGIDAGSILAADRAKVWLSITAYGRTGRAAHRVGFGDDAAAAGGLTTGGADGPFFCADAIADPITGLVGAAVVLDLLAAGGTHLVDLAMARVAAWCARAPATPPEWQGPVAKPRARTPIGSAPALGADTDRVLSELGLGLAVRERQMPQMPKTPQHLQGRDHSEKAR